MSENNPIRVFATHTFEESDDYLRVFEFLESLDRFYYINVSKPENIPTSGGLQAIKDELREAEEIGLGAVPDKPRSLDEVMTDFAISVSEANVLGEITLAEALAD